MVDAEALERGAFLFDALVPGTRLDVVAVASLDAVKVVARCIVGYLGSAARPVRAIAFDKNAETNWSLGWHQDRTIAVRERRDVPGYGQWTVKQGQTHVAPPFGLLAGMLTARIHFDAVDMENAPLLIAPGSHLRGLVRESEIDDVVAECGVQPCLAEAGDVWLYVTPILHASDRAAAPRRRRVLQLDFSADVLPGGLIWSSDTTLSLEPRPITP